ncbi:MAG: hypothetical protein ACJ8LG_09340 [Massilia sp.]
MVPTVPLELPTHTFSALVAYLQESGSTAELEQVAVAAIEDWIAQQRQRAGRTAGGGAGAPDRGRGYQWKALFLPSGSRLRMWYGGRHHYAEVDGDDIVLEGRVVSPAQMANSISGNTRNAWRDIWILRPGETSWKLASLRRRQAQQLEQRLAAGPPAPAAPLPAALPSLLPAPDDASVHLRRLASLIEQALQMRSLPRQRRRTDTLGDDVPFD